MKLLLRCRRRSVIAVEAARRGFKKAFFVTDKDLIKFGVAAEIIKVFDDNQILTNFIVM